MLSNTISVKYYLGYTASAPDVAEVVHLMWNHFYSLRILSINVTAENQWNRQPQKVLRKFSFVGDIESYRVGSISSNISW